MTAPEKTAEPTINESLIEMLMVEPPVAVYSNPPSDALLYGAPAEGFYEAPTAPGGLGRIIDMGSVTLDIVGAAVKPAPTRAASLDDEPEFFIDESPTGSWFLIPDADRLAWNDWCAQAGAAFCEVSTSDIRDPVVLDALTAPDYARPIGVHPRWVVFKSPRFKFS